MTARRAPVEAFAVREEPPLTTASVKPVLAAGTGTERPMRRPACPIRTSRRSPVVMKDQIIHPGFASNGDPGAEFDDPVVGDTEELAGRNGVAGQPQEQQPAP